MFALTLFDGNQHNTTAGIIKEYPDFKSLTEQIGQLKQGGKHSRYFVRGELDPIERKDVNLKESSLLIIDGDCSKNNPDSCVPPEEIHKMLSVMGVRHFIYTTHSHNPPEKNKFRCLIPSKLPSKPHLVSAAYKIIEDLQAMGSEIQFVNEMKVWSQPWFRPSRDDIEDGKYETYSFDLDEDSWFEYPHNESSAIDRAVDKLATKETRVTEGTGKTVPQMIAEVHEGTEYHSNLRALTYGFVKDGVQKATVLATMQGIMLGCKNQDERWKTRFDDLERIISTVEETSTSEDIVDFSGIDLEEVEVDTKLPKPPGLMGELVQAAYDQALYPYRETAFCSAMGLVAGIAGRKFNICETKPMGLNVYMTLIMGTGMGKESIGNFVEEHLIQASDASSSGLSFYGNGDFTSAKAIANQFQDARSQVCVASEAGLMLQTKAGNISSKTKALLDNYSKSHRYGLTKGTSFSNRDDDVPRQQAVSMTIISESTPETLLGAFKDAGSLENGHLPRQSIFRVLGGKPKLNRMANRNKTPKHLIERINHLVQMCAGVQAKDDPEPYEMYFDDDIIDDFYAFCDKCDGLQSESMMSSDHIQAIMASRMFVKAIKYAGIATVFNYERNLTITRPEWEWAKEMVEFEMANVGAFFQGGGGNLLSDLSVRLVGKEIYCILTGKTNQQIKRFFSRVDIKEQTYT